MYIIRCSYFEIYNDAIYDLLNSQKELAFNEPLQLQEDIRVSYKISMCVILLIEERIHRQGTQRIRSWGVWRLCEAAQNGWVQPPLCGDKDESSVVAKSHSLPAPRGISGHHSLRRWCGHQCDQGICAELRWPSRQREGQQSFIRHRVHRQREYVCQSQGKPDEEVK